MSLFMYVCMFMCFYYIYFSDIDNYIYKNQINYKMHIISAFFIQKKYKATVQKKIIVP